MAMKPPEVFSQNEQLELRLASCAQEVLAMTEFGEKQTGRAYCLQASTEGVVSLAVQSTEGVASAVEFGRHYYNEASDREIFSGYRIAFPSAHSAYRSDARHRMVRGLQVIRVDDNELPRGAALDDTLMKQIEQHVRQGQGIFLTEASYRERLRTQTDRMAAFITGLDEKVRTADWWRIPRTIGEIAARTALGKVVFRHPH